MVRLLAFAAFCLAAASQAAAQSAQRVVVVTDPAVVLDSYSSFWTSLQGALSPLLPLEGPRLIA